MHFTHTSFMLFLVNSFLISWSNVWVLLHRKDWLILEIIYFHKHISIWHSNMYNIKRRKHSVKRIFNNTYFPRYMSLQKITVLSMCTRAECWVWYSTSAGCYRSFTRDKQTTATDNFPNSSSCPASYICSPSRDCGRFTDDA